MSTSLTIQRLAQQIRQMERSHQCPQLPVELAAGPLQQLLGEETLPRGCLLEWLGDRAGAGLGTLAIESLRAVSLGEPQQGLVIVVDTGHDLFAPGLSGVALRQTVIVRPPQLPEALWTMEQSLRTPGVAVVFGAIDRLTSVSFRRLQLAAETGGTLGVLLRSERYLSEASFAEYRILARPVPVRDEREVCRRWQLELLRSRRGFQTKRLLVELDHEATNGLRVVPELAAATSRKHAS